MEIIRSIKDHNSLLTACQYVASQARLFNVTQVDVDALFELHVYAQIVKVPELSILNHEYLVSYARGYQECLIQNIRTIECEFVYVTASGMTFGTKVGTDSLPFYGNMTVKERMTARTCYAWRGTAGVAPFTAFTHQAANEEAA